METGISILINAAVFSRLSKDTQDELIDALKGSKNILSVSDDDNEEGLADFSLAQAKKFLDGCGDKTTDAIYEMVKGDSRFFQLEDVAKALKVETTSFAGVWAGITKRTRTVLGDSDVYLIGWHEDGYRGEFSTMTYNSLRKALSLT